MILTLVEHLLHTFALELLVITLFVADVAVQLYVDIRQKQFNWKKVELILDKLLVYGVITMVMHVEDLDNILLLLVNREANLLLQDLSELDKLDGVQDDGFFSQLGLLMGLNRKR